MGCGSLAVSPVSLRARDGRERHGVRSEPPIPFTPLRGLTPRSLRLSSLVPLREANGMSVRSGKRGVRDRTVPSLHREAPEAGPLALHLTRETERYGKRG